MARLTIDREVSASELERSLSDALGARYSVNAQTETRLRVRRGAMIAVPVTLTPQGGSTVISIGTSGLLISRLVQVLVLHPALKRALGSMGARG